MKAAETVETLAAIAHETRLKVYRTLEGTGPAGLSAGAIAEAVGLKSNALSGHLGMLARAGLVSKERQGRSIIYRSCPERMQALARALVED